MTTTRGPWSPAQAFVYDLGVGAIVLVLRAALVVVLTAHAPAPIPAVTFAQALTGLVLLNLVAPGPMRRPSRGHRIVEAEGVEAPAPTGVERRPDGTYYCGGCGEAWKGPIR